MLRRFLIPGILFFFFAVPRAHAAPSLDVSLSSNSISSEENTRLKIQIEWNKAEGNYLFALPEIPLKNLQLTNHAESQETFTKDGASWTRKIFELQLTPVKAGEGKVESFAFNYINGGTQETFQFNVSPLSVHIHKAPFKWASLLKPWLIAPAVIAGAGGLFYAFRKSRAVNTAPELTSEEKAILKGKESAEKQAFTPEASSQLDRILREFLDDYYGLQTSKLSGAEITEMLKDKSLNTEELKTVERLLEKFKEIKFMGASFNENDFKLLKRDLSGYIDSKRSVGLVS